MGFDFGDSINEAAFGQILEMDEEGDNDFSKGLVVDFFNQASETFTEMDRALTEGDLKALSELGHFLKGSSAALGFVKMKEQCQSIQQYGKNMTLDNIPEPDNSVCLTRIKEALAAAKANMVIVKDKMYLFYDLKE